MPHEIISTGLSQTETYVTIPKIDFLETKCKLAVPLTKAVTD